MSWAKFDDGFPDHRKVEALSAEAFRSFVKGVCYCARNLTDGVLPVSSFAYLGRKRYLTELVEAGLFDEMGDGRLSVHDYLDWNPSREKVLAERAATAARVARFRNGVTSGVSNGSPVPVPDLETEPTVPDRQTRARHKPVDEEFIAQMVEEFSGRLDEMRIRKELETAQNRRQWDDYRDKRKHFHDWLERAVGYSSPAGNVGVGAGGARPRIVAGNGVGPDADRGEFPVAKRWPADA